MSLTRLQFDLLVHLHLTGKPGTQRELAAATGWSLGSVNRALGELAGAGWIEGGGISGRGIDALEPYRVKRAFFLAAGFGARMVPVTLNTPKPLVRVQGQRIIDTLLDAVTAAGIDEIYIVRGYLAEQFDQLLYKYPHMRFLENPDYKETNNISSLMCARDHLRSAYLLEADLYLKNPALIAPYQYRSNYLGVPVERTDDWCLISRDRRVVDFVLGGENCHHMFGISFWNERDGARLGERVQDVYRMPGGKERFWDAVALNYFNSEFEIEIRECGFDDLIELDTYRELGEVDPSYKDL